ncbi:CG16892 [Drosophila busckii]|uniref:CG16892 n=1 Tax=Drosophila busckii TaxID=30019 RepID=A0A0M4F8V4_DROBS|nr:aladin [Drosophila busckii]ALC48520.1 CG16892 [Drosophila busckii]
MATLSNLTQCPALCNDFGQRHSYVPGLEHYPNICLQTELSTGTTQRLSPCQSFIPVESESVLKRITRTFFDGGFWESLAEARSEKTREQSPLIGKAGDKVAQLLDICQRVQLLVFPHTQEVSAERIAQYVETRDWEHSAVRCLAWHMHLFKLAVAGVDDVVRIYGKSTDLHAGLGPVLKSTMQTNITCMAWRPLCAFELVVGCRQGLCFWSIDSNVHLGRTLNPSHIFKHPGNLPISTLQWNRDGTQLATASIGECAILVWQPDNGMMQPLKRLGPPGSLLKWSPGDEWMFAATVDRVFRVWKCAEQWSTDRWVCNGGNVQTACWSPCGRFLLFVSNAEPILYRLQFVQLHLGPAQADDKEVMPIANLNACPLAGSQTELVGGTAQQLAMDPHGKYLVISFKTTNALAVFRTYIQKFDLQISSSYYIRGATAAEYPSYICFQPLLNPNDRSVLTIGWSSGRIQYYAFD